MPTKSLSLEEIAQEDDQTRLLTELQTSRTGLTKDEVTRRQAHDGPNVLKQIKGASWLTKFTQNFTSMMAILLWVAGAIAFVAQLEELGIAIWLVNIINGLFSFWQEYQAGKETDALSKMLPSYSRVVRDGHDQKVLTSDLVVGDIVKLEEGDNVAADIRLLAATQVQVDQSALTGEVNPVNKGAQAIDPTGKNHFEFGDIVFSGTSLVKGNLVGVVVKIGMATDFGKIAELTQQVKEDISPLQKELNTLTKQLSVLAVSIGLIFFLVATLFVHYPLVKSFIFALGMIVAFIPEGLSPTVTLSLAGAVKRMARQNALVKKLASVETLGAASVICSDKTGTLTQNQMTVSSLWTVAKHYQVTGEGYEAKGKVVDGPRQVNEETDADLYELLRGGLLADNARLVPPDDHHPRYTVLGDPTEACLEVVAKKAGLNAHDERQVSPRQRELPFDSERKMMTVIVKADPTHPFNTYTKGAPNQVLKHCTSYLNHGQVLALTDEVRQQIDAANDGYARRGLRVLAVAARTYQGDPSDATIANVETGLTFIGLSVMLDPPRKEVAVAAQLCHRAHIKIIMMTGDYSLTAKSIARQIGIVMQILSIDLGTDLIPALGLGKEVAEASVMDRPPRSKQEHLITKNLLLKAFTWYGLLSSLLCVAGFFFANAINGHAFPALATSGFDYRQATTMTLAVIIFCQIAAVLNIRYETQSVFNRHFFDNSMIFLGIIFEVVLLLCLTYVPVLQDVFGTVPLGPAQWLFLLCIPLPLILLDEGRKWLIRHH